MQIHLPRFIAIAALDSRGVIGLNGHLPWDVPEEKKHFRKSTEGHVIIMGHTTFLSMPRKTLVKRTSIVFSKRHSVDQSLALQVKSLEDLSKLYSEKPSFLKKKQFIIGGGEMFNLFFENNLIESAILTHFHTSYPGETYFPVDYLKTWPREVLSHHREFSIYRYRSNS